MGYGLEFMLHSPKYKKLFLFKRLVKDLHGLSTVTESRESLADSAFAEMDNDGDGVVTW